VHLVACIYQFLTFAVSFVTVRVLSERFTNTAKLKDHLVLERRCSGELSFSFRNSMRRIVAKTVCFVTLLNLYTHISIQYDFIIRINVRNTIGIFN